MKTPSQKFSDFCNSVPSHVKAVLHVTLRKGQYWRVFQYTPLGDCRYQYSDSSNAGYSESLIHCNPRRILMKLACRVNYCSMKGWSIIGCYIDFCGAGASQDTQKDTH